MDKCWIFTLLLLLVSVYVSPVLSANAADDVRIAVVENRLGSGDAKFLGFASAAVVSPSAGHAGMQMSTSADGNSWTKWADLDSSQSVQFMSNPVAVSAMVPPSNTSVALVFFQDTKGQVYMYNQSSGDPKSFTLMQLSKDIPTDVDQKDYSHDPIQAIYHKNRVHIFVRSQTNTSQLLYNTLNASLTLESTKWALIGSSGDHLKFDAYTAVNTFLDRIEVFGVFQDNLVHHTWQTSSTSFEGKWTKLGLFSPKFNSSPVAHQMGHSDFNGVLSVFVRGEDGAMHHIVQTTCDKVNNPWGPCTWGLFKKLGSVPPSSPTALNPFTVSHSIHLGVEVFVIGKSDNELYHIWQRERDASWSDWQKIGGLPNSTFQSQPTMVFDDNGWWQAYALNSDSSIAHFIQSPLSFTLSTDKVAYDNNVTVTWAIPEDEATHKDWIGVYPDGASSRGYVDFSYVGGTQNPLKDPVPKGSLNFTATLPNGNYQYKYMVNKEYDAVLEASLSVSDASEEPEWVQVYTGIARGLGNLNVNITECVEDGNITVEQFRAAFDAFEDRKIFDGLHKFAEGLSDFRDALVQCDETTIIKDLTEFIKDLIACTEGNCVNFGIDISVELVILYEHIYEIYGDIQAASNSFKIDAYRQGGICIGRVTYACLTLE